MKQRDLSCTEESAHALIALALMWAVILLFGLLVTSGVSAQAGTGQDSQTSTPASTTISTDIITDTTWTQAGSPYTVTNDVSVIAGVTLTVKRGVEVRFEQGTGLDVYGTLTAQGTASQPITFTGTIKQPGWWDEIHIQGTGGQMNVGSALDYVTVEYGGHSCANLYLDHASATVTHSAFDYSGEDGIQGYAGGVADISDSSFVGNQGYAVQFWDGSVNPMLANLSATGNVSDTVAMGGGTLQGAHTWEATGVPYQVVGDMDTAVGSTLTVEPGVEVRFELGLAWLSMAR